MSRRRLLLTFRVGIWAGISIANYSDFSTWPVVAEADLKPYVDDALAEIEFVMGDAKTTKGGKWRASLGRSEPYKLKFVEMYETTFIIMKGLGAN